MIARMWHGAVPTEKAAEYYEYLIRTGVSDYQATPGNRGVYMLQREENGVTHFNILTFWDDYDAVKAFAGEDYEKSHYYEEDTEYLLELEPFVTHYEVTYSKA
jgi:heme-degrading monooxygenase HmoA